MTSIPTQESLTVLQESIYYGMLSCSLFDRLNIVLERNLQQEKEIEKDTIWTTPRGGASGAGALVEMPKLTTTNANSQVNALLGSVCIWEERNQNMTPNVGTMSSSEAWATMVAEFMRGWILGQAGGLVIEPNIVVPAHDWMSIYPGIMVYRTSVSQRVSRTVVPRCDAPSIALAGLTVTLSNGLITPDADIYYTIDGTFPGLGSQAQLYGAPFDVVVGMVVQCMAFKQGNFFPSHMQSKIIT